MCNTPAWAEHVAKVCMRKGTPSGALEGKSQSYYEFGSQNTASHWCVSFGLELLDDTDVKTNLMSSKLATSKGMATRDRDDECPLCCEEFSVQDQAFRPCQCGYQVSAQQPPSRCFCTSRRVTLFPHACFPGVATRSACGAGITSRTT